MTTAYDTAVAADSPVAWWKLNDPAGSSTVADSSGNGYTGTATNVTFGEGIGGDTCAQFNGSAKVVSTYTPGALAQVTVELWVNFNGLTQTQAFAYLVDTAHTDGTNTGIQVYATTATGSVTCALGNGTTHQDIGTVVPDVGWNHFVCTYDGTTQSLYLNGQLVTSKTTLTGSVATSTLAVTMGALAGNSPSLLGALQEVAIYNTSLSAARVLAHYQAMQPGPYTTNLCPNPSFELGTTGYTGMMGDETLTQDSTWSLYGQKAMKVVTPGMMVGEGFTGPVVTNTGGATTGALSLNFLSTPGNAGTMTFQALDANTGAIMASTNINLDDLATWDQRPTVTFPVAAGQSFQVMVMTTTVQALTYWVDGCQYEMGVSQASPYIDGDRPGCVWLGTPHASASELLYLNATSVHGKMTLSGRATPVQVGLAFKTSASGKMTLIGDLQISSAPPVAAFADFAIFELTDPDPAMTYADQNNAGTNSGTTGGGYVNSYGVFIPPLDYPVSNNQQAWNRAAYMGLGFYFTGIPASAEQNLTDVSVSLVPGTSTPVPAAFTQPRQLVPIIKPNRLNYITNPSFEVSTAGWTTLGSATIAQDNTTVPTATYDTVQMVGTLGSFFNTTGITADGSTGFGSMDGNNSYSATQLAQAGLGPGEVVSSGGINYQMPAVPANTENVIRCQGQVVPVSGVTGASVIGFLGAATQGGMTGLTGTVTFTYSDGTTATATLGFSDWTLDAGAASVSYGNQIAGNIPYRNATNGSRQVVTTYIFSQTLPINPAKALVSVTLPNVSLMRVFGISLAEQTSTQFGSNSGKVGVHANGDAVSISVPDLVYGDIYTASFYTQAGPGLSTITASCGSGSASVGNFTGGVPYGGEPGIGYGQGYFGGVTGGATDIATGIWYRPFFTFTAQASTESLTITSLSGSDVSYPTNFWIDAVLIEPGELLQPYFDGSFGGGDFDDYQWENGGTPGLARSYYYEQFTVKKWTISEILAQHVPLGISAAAPSYLVAPTQ